MAVPVAVVALLKKKAVAKIVKKVLPIVVILLILAIGGLMALTVYIMSYLSGAASANSCSDNVTVVATNGPINVGDKVPHPRGGLLTLTEPMMANAQAIVRAGLNYKNPSTGAAEPISSFGITVALAVSVEESGLDNMAKNPTSSAVGLFQQLANIGWGTLEQRQDPAHSAMKFYESLNRKGPIWQQKTLGEAAVIAQWSGTPGLFQPYEGIASGLVQSILPAMQTPGTTTDPFDTTGQGCEEEEDIEGGPTTPAGDGIGPDGQPIALASVPGIGKINAVIASQVSAMIAAAAADGVTLTGGSYRSAQAQINVRINNCGGNSHYNIYEKPSSACRPPTARPGTSQHELGLAIDFNNCSSRSSSCFIWLSGNASRFGLINFPKEPWHWSTTGR